MILVLTSLIGAIAGIVNVLDNCVASFVTTRLATVALVCEGGVTAVTLQ